MKEARRRFYLILSYLVSMYKDTSPYPGQMGRGREPIAMGIISSPLEGKLMIMTNPLSVKSTQPLVLNGDDNPLPGMYGVRYGLKSMDTFAKPLRII